MAIDNLYGKNYLGDTATYIFGNLPDKIFKRIKHKEKFKLFGYVDSVTLEKSYANCSLFVYPTLNEGFGLPPLEAMKYGKTCAISNVCSLPEVYGDSVYYFDPYDLSEIENRILQGIEHKIPEDKIFLRIKEIENKQAVDLHNLCALISDFETKENT